MRRRRWFRAGMATVFAVAMGGAGLLAGPLTSEPAGAVACGTAIPAGTSCTATGTISLTAGALSLTSPAALNWTGTLGGTDLSLVDTTTGDQEYTVDDATGSGAGWHVTLSATTFTNGAATLPDTGTFSTTGSTSSATATAAPSATCGTSSTCSLPTNTTTYPVAVTTAASAPTAVTVYDTAANTGMGTVVIGGSTAADPVGWWVNVPASASVGSYTSTLTLAVVSAP